ncbi:MAG: manganese efflux pump [Candidatus Cloacimonetes bacterium]|nr:manganese efflux pump [Candidatus Cloacimonadota bacterium]
MDPLTIIVIALGLSLDALAVSLANGIMIKEIQFQHALRIAFFFGFFQAVMPLIGWSAGLNFSKYLHYYDHWIAFLLLCCIGGKMLWESRTYEHYRRVRNCLNFPTLLLMSVATSIDALAVGLSLAFLRVNILTPVVIIGLVTFILSFTGIYLGNKSGRLLSGKIDFIGGIILILIGCKILIEHLVKNI